ncbi:hypothetical protein AQUCO_00600127v1 [Aquilegia coerulea]|uniref:Cytochrome P450 n=1 Tax=Aquilegia coerulea TaxID=218851 RepID=A0A2G5CGP3_AQUCA|nr:hypothetical protein AQUCO_05600088v1 [Aquilegia coerulea]PIA57174.1 hypothetical protein AQUCO_00600127v1 [Aquilegia coerulea]
MQLPITWLSLVLTLVICFYKILKIGNRNRHSKLPPAPWKLPIIGHSHHLLGQLPHHSLSDLAKKHGPLMFLQLAEIPTVIVSSSKVAKEIFKTHDAVFAERPALLAAQIICYDYKCITFSTYGVI